MEDDRNATEIGRQMGCEGVERVISNAERFCEYAGQEIGLTNHPRVLGLRAELALLVEREDELKTRLRQAPPRGDVRSRRRQTRYHWAVTMILTVAGFFFSLLAFAPFRLGSKGYLYCLGIAVITPFSVDKFLETWGKEKLLKAITAVTFTAALASLVILAVIRGDLLIEQIGNSTPVVVFNDDTMAPPAPTNTFYDRTLVLLRLTMALLALAMELGAGLALFEARRLGMDSGEDPEPLSAELAEVQAQMIERLETLTRLETEAAAFEARFWRDFYRSLLTHSSRNAIKRLLAFALAVMVLVPPRASAADRLNFIVLVDLTKSVAVVASDGKTQGEKNLQAVGQLLSRLPAGSHVTVVGITDRSFDQPDILLSASIAEDSGYFNERLATARRELLQAWQRRRANLEFDFQHTDILGALVLAGQLFGQMPKGGRNVLVIFSDMRQNTADLNLETANPITVPAAIAKTERLGLMANLSNVEVHVLGADNAGRRMNYWIQLRQFWLAYFAKTGAQVAEYSALSVSTCPR
ncbi:MAG: hypothetical protein WAQ52_13795 [Terriglobales bacterium]